MSEALILGSTNPQYVKRLLIDLPVQYNKIRSSEHAAYTNCFFYFDIQNNLCTQHVLSLLFSCTELVNQWNNRLSYCGLLDVRTVVSDKDLPVQITEKITTNWRIPIWSEFLRRIKLRRLFQPWQPFTPFAPHLSKAIGAASSRYFHSSAQIKVIKTFYVLWVYGPGQGSL